MNPAQSPFSPRVRTVAASAIRVASKRCLGIELTDLEASQLAEIGGVREAIERLQQASQVRRTPIDAALSRDSQKRIMIAEVVVEAKRTFEKDPAGYRAFLDQLIEKEKSATSRSRDFERAMHELEEMTSQLRAKGAAQRAFLRRVDRLRAIQVNRLRSAIFDTERLNASMAKLTGIYRKYLSRVFADTSQG